MKDLKIIRTIVYLIIFIEILACIVLLNMKIERYYKEFNERLDKLETDYKIYELNLSELEENYEVQFAK